MSGYSRQDWLLALISSTRGKSSNLSQRAALPQSAYPHTLRAVIHEKRVLLSHPLLAICCKDTRRPGWALIRKPQLTNGRPTRKLMRTLLAVSRLLRNFLDWDVSSKPCHWSPEPKLSRSLKELLWSVLSNLRTLVRYSNDHSSYLTCHKRPVKCYEPSYVILFSILLK